MDEEPLQANAVRVVTFQATDEASLDEQVNGWLQEQSDDVAVFNMMLGHAMAVWEGGPCWSFTMTIAYRATYVYHPAQVNKETTMRAELY